MVALVEDIEANPSCICKSLILEEDPAEVAGNFDELVLYFSARTPHNSSTIYVEAVTLVAKPNRLWLSRGFQAHIGSFYLGEPQVILPSWLELTSTRGAAYRGAAVVAPQLLSGAFGHMARGALGLVLVGPPDLARRASSINAVAQALLVTERTPRSILSLLSRAELDDTAAVLAFGGFGEQVNNLRILCPAKEKLFDSRTWAT